MSEDVFRRACKLGASANTDIFIGGGEPTLHPQFELFLGIASLYNRCEDRKIGLVTNGWDKELTTNLLLSESILCAVSDDRFHTVASPEVIQLARSLKKTRRLTSEHFVKDQGRAKTNGIGQSDLCLCEDYIVAPTGTVWACGHRKIRLGNIMDAKFDTFFSDMPYEGCPHSRYIDPHFVKGLKEHARHVSS